MKRRRYIWGYPLASLGRMAFGVLLYSMVVGSIALFSTLGLFAQIQLLHLDGFGWGRVLLLIAFLPLSLFFCLLYIGPVPFLLLRMCRKELPVSVQAYFSDNWAAIPDPRDSRNRYGAVIARRLRELDKLADRLEVPPLYELGIAQGEKKLEWFEMETGLASVEALIGHLRESEDALAEQQALLQDLEKLHHAMTEAASRGARFHMMVV